MWIYFIVFGYAALNSGLAQVFEGSGGDSGDTVAARFVEFSNDPALNVDAEEYGTCVSEPLPGLTGLNIKGTFYQEMFVCPNGFISFTDQNMQNWPYNTGTLPSQQDSSFLAPYWSRVDLPAFKSGESKVRHQSYHKDINPSDRVFNRVNNDVGTFTSQDNFNATWVSVLTWENVKPHNSGDFGGKNQFQVVIVSNETSWYVMYNYADIDWAVRAPRAAYAQYESQAGLPVMGWNAGKRGFDYKEGSEYQNLPYSGTVNAEDIDDYTGNLGTGRWIFDIGKSGPKSADLLCYEWYQRTPAVIPNDNLQCPPFLTVAFLDRRFFFEKFSAGRLCFVNVLPVFGPAVRCCYDENWSLIRAKPLAGSVLSKNPFYFNTEDEYGHEKCCIESNRCEAYYSRNAMQTGQFYRAPHWAWGFGDPHYENMDRMNYTFNGCGEFMFLDGNDAQLQIQVRFSRATGAGLGTVISAVVIKQESFGTIQINLKLGGGVLFLVNGTEYPGYSNFSARPSIINGAISVTKPEQNKLIITMPDGSGIEVKDEVEHLIVTVVLDPSLFGKTKGLLGNWSGTTDDDFLLPNGTLLPPPLTDEQIHYDFGEKWRLSPGQTFFVNTTADQDFHCPMDYQPIFLTNYTFPNSSMEATARLVCGVNLNCLFDIAATLNPEFGKRTLNNSAIIEKDNAIIENFAPAFPVESVVLNMTLGAMIQYTITATDDNGDDVNMKVDGLPAGATSTRTENSLTFSWLVNTTEPFELNFIATDVKNASTSLVPFINVCACENNSTCYKKPSSSEQTALIFNRFYVMDCQCPVGYTGRFCETVKNFCETASGSPCHPLVSCTNSPTGYICGPCPSGYSGEGQNCTDIDECALNTDNCEMRCINTAGSFECRCNSGYQLNADKKNCDDINECAGGHECMHTCSNTEGSYTCSCDSNFVVDPNNTRNCIPKVPCSSGHGCQQVCFVDESTNQQSCSCNRGYKLETDGKSCTDANECLESTDLCSQMCTNTQGSYNCSCIQGYRLLGDGYTCQDVNECIEQPTSCNTGAGEKCFNLPGRFKCDCNDNQGLVRINHTCQVPSRSQIVQSEPAPNPPVPTLAQTNNAVQFRISDFQSNQWIKQTDSTFRSSLAAALTTYCNANNERRTKCGLSRNGFTFSELHVNRLPNQPTNEGNDTLISFYAVYPNGSQIGTNVPVPQSVLLNAWTEQLNRIQQDTGLKLQIVSEAKGAPVTQKDDLDWPLILGVTIAAALVLIMGCSIFFLVCGKRRNVFAPNEEYYERRRWSFSYEDSPYPISGDTYQGFDEDGLPVEAETVRGSMY